MEPVNGVDTIISSFRVISHQLHVIMAMIQNIMGPMGLTGVLIGIVIIISLISTFSFNKSGSSSLFILLPISAGAVILSAIWGH